MEKNNYKKNDCFLLRGTDVNDPMTVFQITSIDEIHIWAKTVSITNKMIDGWPTSDKYGNVIPDNAIRLPSNSWRWAKKQMLSFVKETNAYLHDNIIKEKADIVIGGHYYSYGEITTVKEIGDERIKFMVFKLDEDCISPYWTRDWRKDNTESWYSISDETYNEVIRRYNDLLSRIRNKFCKV